MHFISVPSELYFLVDPFAECMSCEALQVLIISQKKIVRTERSKALAIILKFQIHTLVKYSANMFLT